MNRNNIYIIVIVFLLVTNFVTVVSVRKISQREEETKPVLELPQESRMRYFRGSIGLNEDQIDDFAKYNRLYNQRAGEINRRLMNLRGQMVNEISSVEPNPKVIESVLNDFGDGHIELKRATIDYYNNLKSLCNEQQQNNLELFFRDMLDPEGSIYMNRPGREGRGPGMRPGMENQRRPGRGYRGRQQ